MENVSLHHGLERPVEEVVTLANAVRDTDAQIYDLFVEKLGQSDPSLDDVLKPRR